MATEYDAARERWAAIEGRRAGLASTRTGMEMALSLAKSPSDKGRVPEALQAMAEPFLDLAEADPDKLLAEHKLIVEEQAGLINVEWPAESDRWALAQRQETRRRAEALQPQHRAAVQAMADAVKALSKAIVDERAIRASLGPLPQSSMLPDCSTQLQIGTLDERGSRARDWYSAMRQKRIIRK